MSVLLQHPDVKTLFDLYDKAGHELRLVGGCVRDELMGRQPVEYDFATTALPEQSVAILEKSIPTGIDHGTVTALVNGKSFEITTLRRDVETDGRHAKVIFGGTWEQDAERRDFTVNAMSVDKTGQVYDYFGGKNDLKTKTLRFVGYADKRVQEDYLRILRYFRFLSVLGWETRNADALVACMEYCDHLAELSRERIQQEMYKLLLGQGAVYVVGLMAEHRILSALSPHPIDSYAFRSVINIEEDFGVRDSFRRLLATDIIANEAEMEKIIVPTNKQKSRYQDLMKVQAHSMWPLAKQLYYFGSQAVLDDHILSGRDVGLAEMANWEKPLFPIKAEDVMAFTGQPGPQIGQIMKKTEEYWVDQNFQPDKPSLIEYIKKEFRF